MHVERLPVLLGTEENEPFDPIELESEDERVMLVERFAPLPADAPDRTVRMMFRTAVLNQALSDDPPETWQTFERLHGLGLTKDEIYVQIVMVLGSYLSDALDRRSPFDVESYAHDLALLPIPTGSEIAATIVEVVRATQGIYADDHVDAVVRAFAPSVGGEGERVGGESDQPSPAVAIVEGLVDELIDQLIEGPLTWLTNDRTVYVPDLVDGAVFTHRYNESEAKLGVLTAAFDLGAFSRFEILELDDGTEIDQFSVEPHHLAWRGPDGWLDRFEAGTLLAVSVEPAENENPMFEPYRAKVSLRAVDTEPTITTEVTAAVRAVYDELIAESGLPVTGDELAWTLLLERPEIFHQVQAPLGDLCRAAGMEQRGGRVADDEAIWREGLLISRLSRVFDMIEEPEFKVRAGNALRVLDDPDASDRDVQTALDECGSPETIDPVADVLFDHYGELSDRDRRDTADAPGQLFALVERALEVARRPRQVAAANYLAAVLFERCAEPDIAEEHLRIAVAAQPDLGPAVERLGWYRFDRGDASGAMQRWRALTELPEAAATIQPFLAPSSDDRKLGRNDPCWCGSGRKFKSCHLGSSELPALPDRVGWLCRKATTWVEHGTGDVRRTVAELAACYATGDPDIELWQLDDLDDDDLGLQFRHAFADPILFDAALHEGGLFRLFLLERGPLLPVDEHLLASSWMTVDRSVHEVEEAVPGASLTLRDLATGEVVVVRERSASRQLAVGDRICARVVPDGASHQIIGGLFGVRTGTEEVVLDLCSLGDARELCAWAGRLQQGPTLAHAPGMLDEMLDSDAIDDVLAALGEDAEEDAVMAALGAEMQRQMQERWLDDNVPALGGVTPRQAAADPTRRGQLERLLDEFEASDRRLQELEASGRAGGIGGGGSFGGFGGYDVAWLRRELGLT